MQFSAKIRTPEPDRQLPALPRLCDSSLDTTLITEEAVRRHLKEASTKKPSVSDDLSPHFLKHFAEELSGPLVLVFHQCLQSMVWTSQWEARVTPVHKNKLRLQPNNYWPISLLSVVSKIFKRIISEQLINFLEDHHLQSPRQFVFRRGRITYNLLLFSKSWHDALNAGHPSLLIALDIAWACNCVWYQVLTAKLEKMGITGDHLHLFSSYLTGRRLSVVVNGYTSTSFPVEASVPHRSVLGLILWIIYFNDLLQSAATTSVFADNCILSWAYASKE